MATQGMIVMMRGKSVVRKIVVGCDGYNAKLCADMIREKKLFGAEELDAACDATGFGCADCRVIQTSATEHYPATMEIPDAVAGLYRDKFTDPKFNPRWACGKVAHREVIKLPNAPAVRPAIAGAHEPVVGGSR